MIKATALLSALAAALCAGLYLSLRSGVALTLAISLGTVAYHFGMRLLVGAIYDRALGNHVDWRRRWFAQRPWEARLYALLRVQQWKRRVPTYDPDAFSPRKHTWDEIAQAMCQSELVHETIAVLSFLPLLAVRWFGAFWVFFITSIAGAALDLAFVAVQRSNRPRGLELARRQGDRPREEKP